MSLKKKTLKKDGKKWVRNITKKRKSRFMMSPLVCTDYGKINLEWNIASTTGDSMPYCVETYSGIFEGISNLDINNISNFTVSNNEAEFRDYSDAEVNNKIVNEKELKISNKIKLDRIETCLRGLQYLSIQGNQNNHLTDTTPKFIILAEYSWGNNVFQGIIKKGGVDIQALAESLEDNDRFRISDIWIGVSRRIDNEKYKTLKEKLENEFNGMEYIHLGTVKQAFDGYLEYLKYSLDFEK
ncbi:hypothetical protein CLCAR_3252 [Clostridium carboxidivorans P7]|uniref:hypothetical protein n=1 Tax=Clostridium carboxidivorans TaxID=217159 RepID=UPI0001D3938B|nr:hypothetical protein [Clostridium carboxidivorans]EFG87144.1 hypothetical protein CLCAR_3252 [Clostridium carboxidivorans P7]